MNKKYKETVDGNKIRQYFDGHEVIREVVINTNGEVIMEMFLHNDTIIKIIDYKNGSISKIITFDDNSLISSHKIFAEGSFFSGKYKSGELIKIVTNNLIMNFILNFLRRKNLFTEQTIKLKNSEGMRSKIS